MADELTPAEIAADFLAANPGQMYVSIGARQFERNSVMREAVQERAALADVAAIRAKQGGEW